ncbi:nickel-dependent hydrogenase large subunit [Sulfurimonas sp. SAG-AH-194-I05]|nr:nickel-dependent hydrogenase large subunit [Sulfurimonas sp. SAG-AH-194-I05]MDF1874791.1 nickel-dependent hydrogenase large subunit [Sulfurimonas sp. SAG-AH-194-I05]
MSKTVELEIPLNRVEGDLDIRVSIKDGVIVDAKSIGTLYRGFENILRGRDALDSLVITPRICGICSITHLSAAVEALESSQNITPPPQAVRLRNLSLISETVQSDIRQFFLMYMADFANKAYENESFYEEAMKHYEPFKGKSSKRALQQSTNILKLVAIIGGQWPHTSHMVPGGISTIPTMLELNVAASHIDTTILWYEEHVLGMDIDTFATSITSEASFFKHIESNADTDLARFTNYAKKCNLFEIGKSGNNFLSYGTVNDPVNPKKRLIKEGAIIDGALESLSLESITEDISHAWFKQIQIVQKPFEGVTEPDMKSKGGYTWGKAPRYGKNVMQTGPLAQALVNEDALMVSLHAKYEDCAYVRELARILRPAIHLRYAREQMREVLQNFTDSTYDKVAHSFSGLGVGLVEAARGSLGHWVKFEDGKISNYQIITPTAWNGSPKDENGKHGAWEKSLLGLQVKDVDNPIEMGHVIRSFDPCLVCTVHTIDLKNTTEKYKFRIGL